MTLGALLRELSRLCAGGNGGGGAFTQTIVAVQPGDRFSIVVGSGGSRGIHGVTATPVNEVLKRPEIKQETGASDIFAMLL